MILHPNTSEPAYSIDKIKPTEKSKKIIPKKFESKSANLILQNRFSCLKDEEAEDIDTSDDKETKIEAKYTSHKFNFHQRRTKVWKVKREAHKVKDDHKFDKFENLISHVFLENRFFVLQNLEESKIECSEDKKKCKNCGFKKKCHINSSICNAIGKKCYFCMKLNHFPRSQNCKK